MIKSILFDCFEVLTNGIGGNGEMGRLVQTLGISYDDYCNKDAGANLDILKDLLRGQITDEAYWEEIIRRMGWHVTPAQMLELTRQSIDTPVPGTFDIVRNLHQKGYRLCLISDLWQAQQDQIFRNYPDIMALFAGKFFSKDYGMVKSDPGYFEAIIATEGISPNEAIFIDDWHINVERAQETGIDGILFEDAPQLERELTSRGIL